MVASVTKSKEWLKGHYSKVSASNAAASVGLSPWAPSRSGLARLMLGLDEPPDLSDNPDVLRGALGEPIALHMLGREIGELRPHDQNDRIYSSSLPWASCLPDAWLGPVPAEVKCPRRHTLKGLFNDGIPDYYMIQLQHTMAVTGSNSIWFGALNLEDMKLYHELVNRNQELIDELMEGEREFYEEVQQGLIPEDVASVEFAEPIHDKVLISDPAAIWVAQEFLAASEAKKQSEVDLEYAKDALLAFIGAHEEFEVEGVMKGTHKQQAGRSGFDSKKCIKENPEMAKYKQTGSPFYVFRPNPIKKGA